MEQNLTKKAIASMRGIALDSINKAKGGHIGMAIGAAPITYTLFKDILNISKEEPKWINRDRFILSAGHGSMSMYSIMHFLGLLSKEDMQSHKTLHSKTPSHPEIDALEYVEATTGPLGQGIAMAVGMAIAEKYLASRYNKLGFKVINHNVFALHGDGCLQEGVALEAIQLAGTLKLNKLVLIHDFNNVQIDSRASEVNNIDFIKFFKSQNFNTIVVKEPTHENILNAINKAKKSQLPTYIQIHTIIAQNTPNADTPKGHNGTLDETNTLEFKKKIGLENTIPFEYDQDVYDFVQQSWVNKKKNFNKWTKQWKNYSVKYPELAKELLSIFKGEFTYDFSDIELKETNVPTRNYIVPVMKKLESSANILAGSADLAAATNVKFNASLQEGGKYIKYGIREHAMVAINNGIYLSSKLRTIDSTFLAFADYAKGALRLGSLMEIPSIHVFTHDSYQVGGDGPTHQPFDQIPMLRAMSNMKVIRPADGKEMLGAFQKALNQNKEQYSIIACRQAVKSFDLSCIKNLKPAYVISTSFKFDISLLASGSEVELAFQVADLLKKDGITAQVISVPILQDLVNNDKLIAELNLALAPAFAIEATSDSMWFRLSKYTKFDAFLANGYGYSADGPIVYKEKGFCPENISQIVKEFLK
ncbi:transketolase-like TK C-terminal-containing protein [Mycoplasma phocimorsus]|uniref:transketolase-like TK C-terminal-containing protein n=1 Tax=Mycoplasma phocimorsus TaxID=3045839 RepID=UPI0024BF99D2|nr:transketolase [Mycoplasma phocimorsus]MDJ1646977.1 transketolase [Mycoplasma phocimorsus]